MRVKWTRRSIFLLFHVLYVVYHHRGSSDKIWTFDELFLKPKSIKSKMI